MNIHEYQGKQLFRKYGIPTPRGIPAMNAAEAAQAAEKLIAETGGFLLKEVQLFDVYRGEPVPAGRKSLAYALSFQAPDKTLSDAIVAKQVQRIVKRLEAELGAELRS